MYVMMNTDTRRQIPPAFHEKENTLVKSPQGKAEKLFNSQGGFIDKLHNSCSQTPMWGACTQGICAVHKTYAWIVIYLHVMGWT